MPKRLRRQYAFALRYDKFASFQHGGRAILAKSLNYIIVLMSENASALDRRWAFGKDNLVEQSNA